MEWIQLGTHMIPEECLGPIDLNFEAGTGQGTFVRQYLRNLGTLYGPNVISPPTYLDFRGSEAQTIRRWFTRSTQTSQVTVMLSGEEEPETTNKTRGAGKG